MRWDEGASTAADVSLLSTKLASSAIKTRYAKKQDTIQAITELVAERHEPLVRPLDAETETLGTSVGDTP